jgi:hypothetical protein
MKQRRNDLIYAGAAAGAIAVSIALVFILSTEASFVRAKTPGDNEPFHVSLPPLDTHAYDVKMLELAHVATSSHEYAAFLAASSTVASTTRGLRPWPVKTTYPDRGALLPFNRIVAYYGNFLSTGMGALGKWPPQEMLQRLASTTAQWQAADPSTPVIPALHLIVVTAQAQAGSDGLYRARMSDGLIDEALELATKVHGIVFIDFQVGLSSVQQELPQYAKYLALPNVHVGIDPEFAMKNGAPPGTVVGTFDATDINWVSNYLAGIVKTNDIPPKILMVHRFTRDMVTHSSKIKPLPEVQIVMDMDGWGPQFRKEDTYNMIVAAEPVQFTGFKLFYVNDLMPPSKAMMTPKQVLDLTPAPIYIQYQ